MSYFVYFVWNIEPSIGHLLTFSLALNIKKISVISHSFPIFFSFNSCHPGNTQKPVLHTQTGNLLLPLFVLITDHFISVKNVYFYCNVALDGDPIVVQPYFTLLELPLRPGLITCIPRGPSSCGRFPFSLFLSPALSFLAVFKFPLFHSFFEDIIFYAIIKMN